MDIEALKNKLSRKFRGASIDDVQGIENFSIFSEAASNLLSGIDPYETVRLMRFDVFQGVYDYDPEDDLKGKKVIDPRPQDQRNGEEFSQTFTKEFDRDKDLGKVSVEFMDGQKVLRLATTGKGSTKMDTTEDATEWAGSGGAGTPVVDEVLRMDNSDTIRFDLGAAGGTVTAAALDEVDVSDHEDIGSFFRKIYLPSASAITSITLRVGSSATAYWSITGSAHIGSLKAGINIVRFDWADAVETLAPDSSAMDYEQMIFVTTSAIAGVRMGPLYSKLPMPFEVPYYSNCLFTDVNGVEWKTEPDATTDLIVLEKEAENIFFYECCRLIAEDLTLDEEADKFEEKLGVGKFAEVDGLYAQYKTDKPSETLRPHTSYMNFRTRRHNRGIFRE